MQPLRVSPETPLRLGLGLMYLYSGISLIRDPDDWIGFIPQALQNVLEHLMEISTYLALQGMGEIILGLVFLAWFIPRIWVRIGAALASIEFIGIILLTGVDLVTFRDFGLLGGSLSLLFFLGKSET